MRLICIVLVMIIPFLSGCSAVIKALNDATQTRDTGQDQSTSQNQPASPTQSPSSGNNANRSGQNLQSGDRVSMAEDDESMMVNPPQHVHASRVNGYTLITWDKDWGVDSYEVYHTWSYPQNSRSYILIGVTTQNMFLTGDNASNGTMFYTVKAVSGILKSRMSDYVICR